MPNTVPEKIASITEDFSFAYLKETYIASLLTLARETAEPVQDAEPDEEVQKWGRLGALLQKQVELLRHEMAETDKVDEEAGKAKVSNDPLRRHFEMMTRGF